MERKKVQDKLEKIGFTRHDNGRLNYYVRTGTSRRAVVFIAGFNQPASSWADTVKEVQGHTVVVIMRRQEARSKPSRLLGWQTIGQQQREVVETLTHLKQHELLGLTLTIIGHSVGAMLARHCLTQRRIRDCTEKLVQINPVPLTWWQFTCHLKFWVRGGLLAAPFALLALLCLTRGLLPPRLAVAGLFTGKIRQFDEYYQSLVPDSALVFLQLVCWYNGTKEWETVRQHWLGENVVVGTHRDPTISSQAVINTWSTDPAPQVKLVWFSDDTPHCYWLSRGITQDNNMARLRDIIEG